MYAPIPDYPFKYVYYYVPAASFVKMFVGSSKVPLAHKSEKMPSIYIFSFT
jgi:hypothetical protein